MKLAAIAALSLMVGPSLNAQATKEASTNTANPIVTTVRQMEARYAKNLSGAADEMPADKYSYRPTPGADHLRTPDDAHSGGEHALLCARCRRRTAARAEVQRDRLQGRANQGGERLVRLLRAGPGKSGRQQPGPAVHLVRKDRPGRVGRRCCAWSANWADHYSAASGYLRLNNLLPPSAQKAPGK